MPKRKITAVDILRVVDINHEQLLPETEAHLKRCTPTYEDRVLKEHIWNADDLVEDIDPEDMVMTAILEDLQMIQALIVKRSAGYFRVTYS